MPIFDSAERRYIRRGEVDVDSARRAKALLDELRRTRMLRGGRISEHKQTLRSRISGAIARRAVLPRLAERVAFQLVLKVDTDALGDRAVWLAIGDRLQKEIESLKSNLALVDRQIVVALPKLSADQVAALHDELQAADPAVARTILNVALDAAEPIPAARRYLAAFHRIVDDLGPIDPGIARTVANATFMAHAPSRNDAIVRFVCRTDPEIAHAVAAQAFRSDQPLRWAKRYLEQLKEERRLRRSTRDARQAAAD